MRPAASGLACSCLDSAQVSAVRLLRLCVFLASQLPEIELLPRGWTVAALAERNTSWATDDALGPDAGTVRSGQAMYDKAVHV
jgi:hypothetical protein